MKSFIKKHIPFLVMSLLLLTILVFLLVLVILKHNPTFAEYWTRSFGRSYTSFFGYINQYVPYSITEISFLVTLISCVVFVSWGICSIKLGQVWAGIHKLMMVALVIVGTITMYNASVGLAYNRAALPIEGYKGEVKKEQIQEIATYFVNDYNQCAERLKYRDDGEVIMPYSEETLLYKLRDEFQRVQDDPYYGKFVPKAKPMLSSGIYTSFGIVGMYFGVLGEANYSTYSTNAEKPFYILHELCHGVGVMREDDAQLLSTYLALSSEDYYIRYSCYYNTIDRIIELTRRSDNAKAYDEVRGMISQKIWNNYSYIYYHWKGKMFMSDLGDKINNWYLKTFGQKEGTTSYQDTDSKTDDDGKIYLSKYQSIYYAQYFNNINN